MKKVNDPIQGVLFPSRSVRYHRHINLKMRGDKIIKATASAKRRSARLFRYS